jgi:GDPmannose 4,6-dehydratase
LDPERYITVDPRLFRPADVDLLVSDPTKAKQELGWKPDVSFDQLVRMMVDSDLNRLQTSLRRDELERVHSEIRAV